MSRKKHKHHHGNNRGKNKQQKQQQQQKPAYSRRYIISLSEWKQFERFKECFPHIEEALSDLQENWNAHLNFITEELGENANDYEELHDTMRRLCDLVRGLELPSRKPKRQDYYETKQYDTSANYDHVSYRPKHKYENMVAEILIEDISDGKL